jgi:hypothetical protein
MVEWDKGVFTRNSRNDSQRCDKLALGSWSDRWITISFDHLTAKWVPDFHEITRDSLRVNWTKCVSCLMIEGSPNFFQLIKRKHELKTNLLRFTTSWNSRIDLLSLLHWMICWGILARWSILCCTEREI